MGSFAEIEGIVVQLIGSSSCLLVTRTDKGLTMQ